MVILLDSSVERAKLIFNNLLAVLDRLLLQNFVNRDGDRNAKEILLVGELTQYHGPAMVYQLDGYPLHLQPDFGCCTLCRCFARQKLRNIENVLVGLHLGVVKVQPQPIRVVFVCEKREVVANNEKLVGPLSIEVVELFALLVLRGGIKHKEDILGICLIDPLILVLPRHVTSLRNRFLAVLGQIH